MKTTVSARILVSIVLATALGSAGHAWAEERGQALFEGLCAQCHQVDGSGNPEALAPAIAGLDEWYVAAALHKFRDGVRGGQFDDVPGMRMRPMARTLHQDSDLQAVAAHVASLPPSDLAPMVNGGDPERGKNFYAPCASCHGANGEGNEALNSPPLRNVSDWYVLSSLERFKSGARGWSTKDPTGALMRSLSATLPDEQALLDVVAYIQTFSR